MSFPRLPSGLLPVVVLAIYLLTLLPLPGMLIHAKPFWLGLLVIWLALEQSDRGSLGFALLLGLGADVLLGTWFGEHAFRLVVITFIVRRFRARLRFFTLWQQSLAVGALLLNDRIVILMLRSFATPASPDVLFWLPALVGMLLWPLLVIALDDVRQRLRSRSAG